MTQTLKIYHESGLKSINELKNVRVIKDFPLKDCAFFNNLKEWQKWVLCYGKKPVILRESDMPVRLKPKKKRIII